MTYVSSHSVWDVENQFADRFVLPKNRVVQNLFSSDLIVIFRFLELASDLGLCLSGSQSIVALKKSKDVVRGSVSEEFPN